MNAQPSRLAIEQTDDRTIAAVGVIDSHTADSLSDQLQALGTEGDIALNLQGVDFIDSSGLRSIVTGHQALEGGGNRLVLVGVSDAVTRLLEITGLQDHLHFGD